MAGCPHESGVCVKILSGMIAHRADSYAKNSSVAVSISLKTKVKLIIQLLSQLRRKVFLKLFCLSVCLYVHLSVSHICDVKYT